MRSRKTVGFSEQKVSAEKYPSLFSHQMEAIVYSFVAAKIRASEKASLYVDLDIASPVQYPKPLCFRKIIEKKNFAFERQDACRL